MINLIDRLKSITNVRSFMIVYRSTGINGDKPLDISHAVWKVERYIGERVRAAYPDEDVKLLKSLKQCLAVLENDYHLNAIPAGMGTGEDYRRVKLLEGLEEVCKDASGLVNLFKDLGTYDGIVLDLCYLFHYLPTPDRNIITTLKVMRNKMTEDRIFNPRATNGFFGTNMTFSSASKEKAIPNYECEEGRESEVRTATDYAIKHGPGNPPESLWGAARLVKHFPYVHTANTAFVQAKDVNQGSPLNYQVFQPWTNKLLRGMYHQMSSYTACLTETTAGVE